MIYKVLWAVISVKKRTVHANSSTEIGKSSKLSTERECRKGSWFKDRDFRKEQFTVCRKLILTRIGYAGVLPGMRLLIR